MHTSSTAAEHQEDELSQRSVVHCKRVEMNDDDLAFICVSLALL